MPDERLDIVNDDDLVTGQEMRAVVHQRGLQHRGIHVFLVTPEGELLVQQRGRHRELCPLALDCSVSEHVKAGESYSEAAARGLAEELGIRRIAIHALVKFRMDYGPNDRQICQLYQGIVDPSLVQFDPDEVEGIACYSLDKLNELICEEKEVFSDWFVQLLYWYQGQPSRLQVLKNYPHKQLLLLSG
jgi:isopentenyldiphosphate isomerase